VEIAYPGYAYIYLHLPGWHAPAIAASMPAPFEAHSEHATSDTVVRSIHRQGRRSRRRKGIFESGERPPVLASERSAQRDDRHCARRVVDPTCLGRRETPCHRSPWSAEFWRSPRGL